MTQQNYFTRSEAAKFLGIEKWALDYLRFAKLGPRYVRKGKKVMYNKVDVMHWGMGEFTWIH